ncbi:hypothetical protein BX600DRAFT_443257 [Xylariales sp. PMI_506]|nr:hypothetical protein BX600DRAFT_443257 [Xylariales sp. PMI_506]
MCQPAEVQPGSEPVHFLCGTGTLHRHNLATIPGFRAARQFVEQFSLFSKSQPPRTWTAQIPVVVHVVYNTDAQNISQAQIDSQIKVLNTDFNAKNPDLSTVPDVFKPLITGANINFFLAKRDPTGKPTDGVTRTKTSTASFEQGPSGQLNVNMTSSSSGGADPWPSTRYLNLWVCPLGGGLLGFANIPSLNSVRGDGVVISYKYFGTSGTATAPYHLGRTAVHEIGHWLNLFHIWGDDGIKCSGSDQCDDTPNQSGPNSGDPSFPHVSCNNGPNGDLFMNYMDYSYDDTTVMFTKGQVDRINATIAGPRASLFGSNFTQFILQTGSALHETDQSFQFIVTDWNGDGHPDIVAIKKSGTASKSTEVHVLSGASNFQTFILQSKTTLHETGDSFEFLMGPRRGNQPPDLIAVSKSNTGSHASEVHILSGAKNYQEFTVQTASALPETDGTFQFALTDWNRDGSSDLVAIKKSNTGSRSTEVHILSASSGYKNYLLQTGTPLQETDDTYEFIVTDWNGDSRPDLFVVRKTATDTDNTEVMVLSGRDNFQTWILKSSTILHKTEKNFQFALADWDGTARPDLFAIKKSSTGTKTTEVHILSG